MSLPLLFFSAGSYFSKHLFSKSSQEKVEIAQVKDINTSKKPARIVSEKFVASADASLVSQTRTTDYGQADSKNLLNKIVPKHEAIVQAKEVSSNVESPVIVPDQFVASAR